MYFPTPQQLAKFPTPNYVNPELRGNALTLVDSIFLGIATVCVALRLYTRLFVRKWFGLDDVCICLGFACSVSFNAITFLGIDKYDFNRHIWDIPIAMASMSLKLAFFGKLLYILASMFIAYAILAFYYRLIAESGSHWFRMALHVVLAFNIGTWTAFFIGEIFICTPVQYYWSLEGPPGAHCLREGPLTLTAGIVKTVIDVVITTLPLPLILRTEMRRRQRYMVAALFALGYVVTAAGAARVYYTYKAFYSNGDISWWQYPTFITSSIENNIAIVCACAPTIRPLFPHWFGPESRFRGWITSQQPSTNPSKQVSDQKRSSNISQYGSRIRSFGPTRTTQSETASDDMELVIQKHIDHGDTSPTDRSNSDIGIEFGIPEQASIKGGVAFGSRAMKTQSTITVRSGNTSVNPFDPRLDIESQTFRPR